MAKRLSAGLLLYRISEQDVLQLLIVHMGGPFWQKKDLRGWSIPKGEYTEGDDPFEVACREFKEELGQSPPSGDSLPLGEVKQPSGKVITAWAIRSDFDTSTVSSNTFTLEWPKGSGRQQEFPEVDRAEWHDAVVSREKLVAGQVPFIDLLKSKIGQVAEGNPMAAVPQPQPSLF
jgi:predicted NUDIX family NTP pyrophosphohydrolase